MTARRVVRRGAGALAVVLLLLAGLNALRAQIKDLPPKPDRYVTDQAGVLDAATTDQINTELDQFERDTSNQIVVCILPSLPPDSDIAQYATYTYNAWQIGQKGKDNGALLLIAYKDHKMFIATGRGLEGALPDATCENIISQVITPHFKQGDYAGGIEAGVSAMMSASKGEYKGNGSTDADGNVSSGSGTGFPGWAVILIIIVFFIIIRARGGGGGMGPMIFTGGGWGGGGFGGGGGGGFGGGGGGGGGFSGGGGSSAGGGAGGSW